MNSRSSSRVAAWYSLSPNWVMLVSSKERSTSSHRPTSLGDNQKESFNLQTRTMMEWAYGLCSSFFIHVLHVSRGKKLWPVTLLHVHPGRHTCLLHEDPRDGVEPKQRPQNQEGQKDHSWSSERTLKWTKPVGDRFSLPIQWPLSHVFTWQGEELP